MYTRSQFISKVAPLCKSEKILPSLTIAQAILESADGNSQLTQEGNALFGVKASKNWTGKVWTGHTVEYYDGKTATNVIDGFRAYNNWEESIKDHLDLLTRNKRYSNVVGQKDYKKACYAIQAAGYATDPNYANKLISLIENYNLTQYDAPKQPETDKELFNAVSYIIRSGIKLDFNIWKRTDLFELNSVPFLIDRLGGLDKINSLIVDSGMSFEHETWANALKSKQFNPSNVRSLLIKYSIALQKSNKKAAGK